MVQSTRQPTEVTLRGSLRRGLVVEWLFNKNLYTKNRTRLGGDIKNNNMTAGTVRSTSRGPGHVDTSDSYAAADVAIAKLEPLRARLHGAFCSIEGWASYNEGLVGVSAVGPIFAVGTPGDFDLGITTTGIRLQSHIASGRKLAVVMGDTLYGPLGAASPAGQEIQHFVAVHTPSTLTVYVNSVASVHAGPASGINLPADAAMALSSGYFEDYTGQGFWWSPRLAVRVWDRPLTSSEVSLLYQQGPNSLPLPRTLSGATANPTSVEPTLPGVPFTTHHRGIPQGDLPGMPMMRRRKSGILVFDLAANGLHP